MSKTRIGPVVILCASAIALGGLTYYALNVRDQIPDKPDDQQSEQQVNVPKPDYEGNELVLKDNLKNPPADEDPLKFAVNEYLDQIPSVPREARVTEVVKRENGLVELHFTPDLIAGYGSEEERTIIQGILKAAGQFEDVRQVQFMVEGQPLDSLGHLDLTVPLDVER